MYPMLPCSLDCSFILPLRCSLIFIYPVSCVPYVACFFRLSFFIAPSVFSNIYLSCVLCTLYCEFLWIFFFIAPSVFTKIYLSSVLCTLFCQFLCIVLFFCPFGILWHVFVLCLVHPILPVSLDCHFFAPSVFSNIYLSCVMCTLCCQFLWIVLFYCPFGVL